MNRYKRIKDQIMVPSEAAQRELREKIEAARPAPKANLWLRRALPLAACLLLLVGGTLMYFRPMTPAFSIDGEKITGLPVKHELLSDMPGEKHVKESRIAFLPCGIFLIGKCTPSYWHG